MADENKNFISRTKAFIAASKVKAMEGLTWSLFGDILFDFLEVAVEQARSLALEGYQKKAEVLDALALLIDTITIPVPWYLAWAKPAIKRVILAVADGAIEVIYARIKNSDLVPSNPKLAS